MKRIILILLISTSSFEVYSQKELIVIPNGHSLQIEKVVLDDQQQYLYSAEQEKIIMWNATNGNQMYTFPLGGNDPICMAISHAGDKIVFTRYGKFFCYSTITGKQLFSTDYKVDQAKTLCFTADDKYVLAPGNQGVGRFDATTGKQDYLNHFSFDNHFFELYIINGGSDFLLVGEEGWQVRNAQSGVVKTEQKLPAQSHHHWYLPFSKILVNAVGINSIESILTFQNIDDGIVVKKLNIASDDNDILVIPSLTDNHFVLKAGYDKRVKYELYKSSDFTVEKTFGNLSPRRYHDIVTGAFIGDKNKLYASAYSDLFKSNTKTGNMIQRFKRTVASLGFDVFSSYEYNSQNGELNWVCDDSTLKRINLFTMKSERHVVINTDVEFVAISPGGDSIAVFDDTKSYLKNIANNTMLRRDAKIRGHNERLLYTFSNDGKFIYYPDKEGLYKWNLATDVKTEMIKLNNTMVENFSADKQFITAILTINENKFAEVINLISGKVIFKQPLNNNNNEGKFYLQTSADNQRLLVCANDSLTIYDLATKQKVAAKSNSGFYTSGAIRASNDLSIIAVGGFTGYLTVYKSDGTRLYDVIAHNSTIRNVFFSPDDRMIYTVSHDQTIKVWQAATEKLLGTLYLFSGTNDYVFVDEFGRFDGTPEGIKKLYYLKNRKEISLDLVYEKYYTPNLYQRLVNGEVFTPFPTDDLKLPPKVKMKYAEMQRNLEVSDDIANYKNTSGVAEITINATAPEDKIDEIRLFHNGKVVNLATRGLFVTDNDGSETKKYTINLLPGNNSFMAIALNSQRTESDADEITVSYSANGNLPAPKPITNNNTATISTIDKNATMYLMVVGINAYTNKIHPLTYALPDATSFRDEIEKDAKSVLANVKTYFITDAKADKAGIVNAFNEIKKEAKPQDVFVFYYAGHGYINPVNKEFYLVSADVADGGESLIKNGIPAKDLQQYAVDIQAQKQLFILDACQSAGAFDAMLKHDGEQQKSLAVVARSTGTHWMAASGSTETAKEFGELGHGAFTYVLLQALKGQAALNKMITVNGMKTFLQVQVPELVKKYGSNNQYPASYGFGNDFPVEIVK